MDDDISEIDYQYSSLTQQQLRLLRPIYTRNYDDMRFEIRHVSRKFARSYTAVSYTWGDQQPTKTIRLNGKLFRVRPNLLSCLYYLSRARNNARLGWDWIWVDAICINQQDDREKSEQVGLMNRTYSDAEVVSLWLGLAPISPYLQDLLPSQEEFSNGNIITFEDGSFFWDDHLDDLLNRPYWSRFWTIQEFLLAREIHYYCSDNMTTSERFYQMLTIKTDNFPYGTSTATNKDFNKNLDTTAKQYMAASLILARNVDMFPQQGSSLHDLLLRHRRAQCKDRRDRVFALLSLLGDEEHKSISRFLPNYTLNDDQVAVIALAHMMNYREIDYRDLNQAEITIDSDDVFQALGLAGDRAVRKHMLTRAKHLDYYDDWTSVDIGLTMTAQEAPLREYDTFNDGTDYLVESVDSVDGSSRKSPACKALCLIAFLAVIGGLAVKYLKSK